MIWYIFPSNFTFETKHIWNFELYITFYSHLLFLTLVWVHLWKFVNVNWDRCSLISIGDTVKYWKSPAFYVIAKWSGFPNVQQANENKYRMRVRLMAWTEWNNQNSINYQIIIINEDKKTRSFLLHIFNMLVLNNNCTVQCIECMRANWWRYRRWLCWIMNILDSEMGVNSIFRKRSQTAQTFKSQWNEKKCLLFFCSF